MSTSATFKKLAVCAMITGSFAVSHIATAHTTIQVKEFNEKTSTYNNVVIGHGCHDAVTGVSRFSVVAQSVVFPDVDAVITDAAGNALTGSINDYVTKWTTVGADVGTGFGAKIKNTDVFEHEGLKLNATSDRVGFYGIEGDLPGIGYLGLTPFRTSVAINPASCAKSVTFKIAVADICKVTTAAKITTETVNTWVPAANGSSMFNNPLMKGYGSPASMKVLRATTNVLPVDCGAGVDVVLTPSGAQLDRDLPIKKANGEQYWPKH